MFKWLYNLFNDVFGGGTKGNTNIIWKDGHENGMTFDQAMSMAKHGWKVKHKDWRNTLFVIYDADNSWKKDDGSYSNFWWNDNGVLKAYKPTTAESCSGCIWQSCGKTQ